MALTDLQVKKLAPKHARYEVLDGKGLYLRIAPTGTKSWLFRYQFNNVTHKMFFGIYPAVSLAEARKRHAESCLDIQNGIDPALKLKEVKAKVKTAPTFSDLLDEFWELELSNKPTGAERKRLVEKDALPAWTKRKIRDITRRDAVLLLDGVRKRAPVGANRLQTVLVRMFNFAAERGIIEFSPLSGMRRGEETARSRVLSDEEIKNLWAALDLERPDIDIYRLTKLALKAILLTGQRPGEVCAMTVDQIEGDTWIIPAEGRKNREENRVPILTMFREVINTARIYSGEESPYVFRSTHDHAPKKRKPAASEKKEILPVTVRALARALVRHRTEMEIPDRFTPHDLRRTLRTRLAELGVADIVAERLLGHKLQGILAVYNRYGYDAEKRAALTLWEQRLQDILSISGPSNVIQFRSAHADKK